jgi:hypothetical protein
VKDAQGEMLLGRTNWKRFAAVGVPTLAAAGVMSAMMANGALAASFAVSGQSFKLSANRLEGKGFAQFGGVAEEKGENGRPGRQHPIAVSAVGYAEITRLCQSVRVPVPAFGSVTMTITAGNKGKPVIANNLVVDTAALSGDATFRNIELGRDASTIDKVSVKGPSGLFAQQADTVTINNLQQTAWRTTAGTFKVSGIHLGLKVNGPECFAGSL